jgi:hypothetical protein
LLSEVVPKYFAQKKYESFTRQLNGWGFKLLHQAGNDFNAYYHECFLRGLPQLIVMMKRAAPNQGRLLPHVEGEPNFYEIDKHFKLPPSGTHHCQSQYPPQIAAGAGNGFPPDQRSDSNEFFFYPPGSYQPGTHPPPPPPPPPFYGHPSYPHAMAAYPSNMGYSPYPPYYHMPYGPPPAEQYPHYSHPLGPRYGAQSNYDDVPPNSASHAKTEYAPLAPVPPYYHMPYAPSPPEQYPHDLHPLGPQYSAQSQYDNVPPPSSVYPMESEEDPSLSHQEIAAVQRTFQEDDQPKEEF